MMGELQRWLEAACAVRNTCLNQALFDATIAAQERRLLRLYFPELALLRLTTEE